ncbi:MAG: alkaline phosphatase family protein [Candidatus Omnitrophota bacterium]
MTKIMQKIAAIFLFSLAFCITTYSENNSKEEKRIQVGFNEDGTLYVPTEQIIEPAGMQVTFPGRPTDFAVSPDEKLLAVKNKSDLILIDIETRRIRQSLSLPRSGHSVTGILFSPDGRLIYTTDAESRILRARLDAKGVATWDDPIDLPAPKIGGDCVPAGITYVPGGRHLLAALTRNNSLGVVNLENGQVEEIETGMCPFMSVCAPSGKIYVSNWGGRRPEADEAVADSAGSKVLVDEDTGIANSGTVTVIDWEKRKAVGEIETGLHPSSMVLSPDGRLLFVANSNSDSISLIDADKDLVVYEIETKPNPDLPFGSAPTALAIDRQARRLFATLGGNNAVAVFELSDSDSFLRKKGKSRLLGCIPTGWYPGAISLTKNEKIMFVANVKGLGSLNQLSSRTAANSHDHLGSISFIPQSTQEQLDVWTQKTANNNRLPELRRKLEKARSGIQPVPVPERHGEPSLFDHVVYIIKENRTYDQVLGDLPQGNGEPSLVHFGREITPNHHALAEEFVLFDNFYCSGVLSADGHQWTNEAYVTDYLERFFGDFNRSYPYEGSDPLAYASSGFIWDNVLRHGLTFRVYGEFTNPVISPATATFMDIYQDFLNGAHTIRLGAKTDVKPLESYLCPAYPGFTNKVPDVYRAEEFIRELRQFEEKGSLPNFTIMLLPNDHTSGTSPGRPSPRAAVADNDLALGRIVEAISRSRFWPKTCIFVVEDDPQAGLDHVDAHRTVAFVISPYTRRGYVDSIMYTQPSMVKTMELILGLPPMNQFDLMATPMRECFQAEANLTSYSAKKNNVPLDEINPPLKQIGGLQRQLAEQSMQLDFSAPDRIDEDTLNRIVWHSVKGYGVPYPEKK